MDNCVYRSPVGTVYRFTYQRGLCVARLATMGNAKASNAERAMGTGSRFSFYILGRRNEPFLNEKLDAMGLFDLLQFSLSSLFYGVLITAVCLVLFFVLIRGWYKSATMTPISYVVGIVLFFLLSFQCTLIMGAIKIIHISNFYAGEVQQLMQQFFQSNQEVTVQQSTQIVENLVDTYPVLGHFFQSGEFSGYTAAELPEAMRTEICSFLRWFIVRRLLWCLAFVVVGAFWVIRSLGSTYVKKRRTTSYTTHYPRANHSRGGF